MASTRARALPSPSTRASSATSLSRVASSCASRNLVSACSGLCASRSASAPRPRQAPSPGRAASTKATQKRHQLRAASPQVVAWWRRNSYVPVLSTASTLSDASRPGVTAKRRCTRSSSLASAKPTTPRLGRLRSRAMSTGTGGAVCVSMIPETTPRRSSSFGTAAAAPAPPTADGAAAAPDPKRSARTAAARHLQAAAAEHLRAQQPPPPQHTSLDLRSAPSGEGGGGFDHGAV
mmetsp:Transcript_44097/g.143097  ORF Transcript_44097/g.143097 Transcript_44097/m.143097 type:complete len:235 (+) Transcript_44097:128-832(+)